VALLGCAGALLVAGVGTGIWSEPAGAISTRPVVATASAQGIRATYTVPDYVAVATLFDGGGPVSEATGDSTGRAVTFASLPYPSETAVFFPGVMAAATGVQPPAGYPFYARADYPTTPKSEVVEPSGSYVLRAEADRGKANGLGTAQFIGEGADAVSRSAAETHVTIDDDGNVTVVAESANSGLSLGGGALTIASVRSRSTSTYQQGSDKPVVARELVIDGARAFKQSVTIGPDGVHADDETAPLPVGEGTKNLNEALKQSGITVRTVSGDTEAPGSADFLEVTSKHPVPVPGNPQGTFVWRLGAATTAISLGPASDAEIVDALPAAPADQPASAPADSAAPPSVGSGEPLVDPTPEADMSISDPTLEGSTSATTPAFSGGSAASTPAAAPANGAAMGEIRTRAPRAVTLQPARTFQVSGKLRLVYGLLGVSAGLLVLSPGVWRLARVKKGMAR
jgi:hypothetical protein